ncbi:MAG: hypothetical protein Kow0049_02330 [Stanieria sp.]
MVSTSSDQFSSSQSSVTVTQAEDELNLLVVEHEHQPEQELDLDFLFTRDIEFRQETIYFIVVDRFYDGYPNNSEGPNLELYDQNQEEWGKYWGDDLQGIIEKLDYLKHLGVTAVWLTPLFEQVGNLQ